MILPSVFVQIPAQSASLVPAKVSTSAQSVGRSDEIKAEPPIKSEIDNANQSQTVVSTSATAVANAAGHKITKDLSSTRPSVSIASTLSSSSSSSNSIIVTAPNLSTNVVNFLSPTECNNVTANLVTARPKVKCFKCELCPFMSISHDGYNNHVQTVHNNSDYTNVNATNRSFRNKILCPGCENVFYSKMSLKIHLVNDHQMSRSEISQLLESLFAKKTNLSNKCSSSVTGKTDAITVTASAMAAASVSTVTSTLTACMSTTGPNAIIEKGTEKQKIYLKNVEVLQNPRFIACEYNVQSTPPPTILSPSETQSECSSNLTDDIVTTDASIIIDEMNSFNQCMPNVRTFNQLDNNCLYQQHITNIEQTPFQMVSAAAAALSLRSSDCMNLNDTRECMPMNAISPIIDDAQSNRPDSGSSVKFSENFLNTDSNIWPIVSTIATTGNAADFTVYQSHMNLNQCLPSIRMLPSNPSSSSSSLILTPTPPPPPPPLSLVSSSSSSSALSSSLVKEKKKIYIKNIDILKEPLIKPVQTISLTDSNCRKNTLHLRTVDEVNLLIKVRKTSYIYDVINALNVQFNL